MADASDQRATQHQQPFQASAIDSAGPRPKSAKRKAAEALLLSRYVKMNSCVGSTTDQTSRSADTQHTDPQSLREQQHNCHKHSRLFLGHRHAQNIHSSSAATCVHVTACQPGAPCCFRLQSLDSVTDSFQVPANVSGPAGTNRAPPASRAALQSRPSPPRWTSFNAAVPHLDLVVLISDAVRNQAVGKGVRGAAPHRARDVFAPSAPKGTQPATMHIGPIQVLLVDSAEQAPSAIRLLRDSMDDPVVAIDLEWKPDRGKGRGNPVALIQLATSKVVVLLRVSKLERCTSGAVELPAAVVDFMREPGVVIVAFGWDSSDSRKWAHTFGAGKDFAVSDHICDLQVVASHLGYGHVGLARLAQAVLGVALPKPKKVTMSDWSAPCLTIRQAHYAALDALLTGHIFRGLRLWHSIPSDCAGCKAPLGLPPSWDASKSLLSCGGCDLRFVGLKKMAAHCKKWGHKRQWSLCAECGRSTQGSKLVTVPQPVSHQQPRAEP